MCAHVEFGVVEDLLLEELLLAFVVHVLLEEVEGRVGFLSFDGPAESLLLLEDCVEVLVVSVVAAALDVAHGLLLLRDGGWWYGRMGNCFVLLLINLFVY